MVQKRTCDYSGQEIEPGTGTMYVKSNGTVLWFADAKCEKNYLMGREARDLEWIGDDDAVAELDEEETEEVDAEDDGEDVEDESEADSDDEEADADNEADEADAEDEPVDDEDEEEVEA